jgi:hypothetical protein
MWALINLRWRVALIVTLAAVYTALFGYLGLRATDQSGVLVKIAALVSPISATLLTGWLIGICRSAWTLPCQFGLGKVFFPDLNGRWKGTVNSSYHIKNPDAPDELVLRVDQTWGKVEVFNDGEVGVSDSTPIVSLPARHNGRPCLYVVYEGRSKIRSDTDSERFLGSERITYNPETRELTGEYMTDRAWMRGENTAGRFTLKKVG